MLFCHLAWRFVYASSSSLCFLSSPFGEGCTLPSLQLLDCLSFFFLFLFYDGSKKEEEKGVGRSMSIFFYFFDSPFDEWRIRLFGIGWGVV